MEDAERFVADVEQFVSGGPEGAFLWPELAGLGKLQQGLRGLVAAEPANHAASRYLLECCWKLLSQPTAEKQLQYRHQPNREVDVGRIARHARALVAAAQAALTLSASNSYSDTWDELLKSWHKAGELLTQS